MKNHESLNQLANFDENGEINITTIKFLTNNNKIADRFKIKSSEYINKLDYLTKLNNQGYNIYMQRNMINSVYVDIMLDDVNISNLFDLICQKMIFFHLETSGKNFQVVIRFLNNINIDKEQYLALNRFLIDKYKADKGSAGFHNFRLAGFTNQKPKYLKKHLITYDFSGNIIDLKEFIAKNNIDLDKKTIDKNINNDINNNIIESENIKYDKECDDYVSTIYLTQKNLYINNKNRSVSELDFKIVCLCKKKNFNQENIAYSILKHSPDLLKRKGSHYLKYINTTRNNAY